MASDADDRGRGGIEEDVQTDEMLRSERPIMRTLSLRRRLRGRINPTIAIYWLYASGVNKGAQGADPKISFFC